MDRREPSGRLRQGNRRSLLHPTDRAEANLAGVRDARGSEDRPQLGPREDCPGLQGRLGHWRRGRLDAEGLATDRGLEPLAIDIVSRRRGDRPDRPGRTPPQPPIMPTRPSPCRFSREAWGNWVSHPRSSPGVPGAWGGGPPFVVLSGTPTAPHALPLPSTPPPPTVPPP